MKLNDAIQVRMGAKFSPRQWVEGEVYDCVTFIASVYQATETIGEITLPDYRVFGKGTSMRDLTCEMIDGTGGFEEVKELSHGCAIVFSYGDRGHHAGIYLDGGKIAHCARGTGVTKDSFIPPLSDHVFKIYRPKNHHGI